MPPHVSCKARWQGWWEQPWQGVAYWAPFDDLGTGICLPSLPGGTYLGTVPGQAGMRAPRYCWLAWAASRRLARWCKDWRLLCASVPPPRTQPPSLPAIGSGQHRST